MSEPSDATRWRLVETIFEAALERPPAERDAYLRDACAHDSMLHQEVATLLAHYPPTDDPSRVWAAPAALHLMTSPARLEPRQRVGPYEIVSFLAAGGMGAVYRARDPRMGRDVAIKVSAEQFSDRFAREVRAVAALNHPNVCTLYDVGPDYLVMELLEGETLAAYLARRGALPLDHALGIARQIAAGLEAAHVKGVTHRDLKPANIWITPDETVKVVDFGLATVTKPFVAGDDSPDASSTPPTILPSRAGTIVGTAAYMSPEQARGKPVDTRTDVWAFGVVLFEMLSGTRLYTGETLTDVLAAVISRDPDWSLLPGQVPARLRDLLELCLQRDPRDRLRDMGDVRLLIDRSGATPTEVTTVAGSPRVGLRAMRRVIPWLVAVLVVMAMATSRLLDRRAPLAERPPVTLSLLPPEQGIFLVGNPPALSPDARRVAFVAEANGRRSLWIRDLEASAPRELPGTEGAALPFWKPDGQAIAFFADGKLKRMSASGNGAALSLGDADGLRGGSWSPHDVIVFGAGHGELFRMPAEGGAVTQATMLDAAPSTVQHGFPWFLPDGRHFLYTAISDDPAKTAIYSGDLDSPTRTLVASAFSNSAYVEPGYVLYVRENALVAQPFDAATQRSTGAAVPIVESLEFTAGRGQPRYQFAASQNGMLAYMPNEAAADSQLALFDRFGHALGTIGPPSPIGPGVLSPAFSPDGTTVAVARGDPTRTLSADIWLHNLNRGGDTRLTANGQFNGSPVWSPDGRFVAFNSGRPGGTFRLLRQAVDGSSAEELLDPLGGVPNDWSRDDRYLLMNRNGGRTGYDVWVLPLVGARPPYPYLDTPFNELMARFSPNGHWVAYASNDTSQYEIYVDAFPQRSHKQQVSIHGGDRPVWSRDGKEVFFISADHTMQAVDVRDLGDRLDLSEPHTLFASHIKTASFVTSNPRFDVSADGRFVIPVVIEHAGAVPMRVVLNWTSLIRK